MKDFIEALGSMRKDNLIKFPKADLHNHAVFSCDRDYLSDNNIDIPKSEVVTDIASLISFARKYIKPLQNNIDGLTTLLKGTFEKCLSTGVTIVDTDIDYKICIQVFDRNIKNFIRFQKSIFNSSLLYIVYKEHVIVIGKANINEYILII